MTLNNGFFVCFDIETTGLNPLEHTIIEIGAVKFSIEQGIIDKFSSLIAFEGIIPEEVIKIHGITDKMLKNAPSINMVINDFLHFIDRHYLIAHNASFDTSFIGYQLGKLKIKYPDNPIYDTLTLSRKVFPHFESYSLSNLKKKFQIKVSQSHRALDDANATMQLFTILIKSLNDHENKSLDRLSRFIAPISFSTFTLESFNVYKEQVKQINHAIESKQKILITYSDSKNAITKRTILPSIVLLNNGYIYLEGYCFLRKRDRRFRLDRIKKLSFLSNVT